MLIDPNRVEEIMVDCLHKGGESTDGHPAVEGILHKYIFHPDRLEAHKQEITEMLECLPSEFMASGGGGMSFLNACMDKDEDLWTGLHLRMEQLLCLGIAIDKGKWLLPKDMWPLLPGGMPYYVVKDADA